MAKLKPMPGWVVVEVATQTESGILLPPSRDDKSVIATVVAVGPPKPSSDAKGEIPSAVKEGDKIIYGGFSNTPIKLEGKDYILVKEEDILATVK